jgi:C_GCAxxG_C_C family probable redox protein
VCLFTDNDFLIATITMRRRKFISATGFLTAAATLPGCKPESKSEKGSEVDDFESSKTVHEEPIAKGMSFDQLKKLLDMKAAHYMEVTNNCAQSTFLALAEVFGLKDKIDVKALTAIPGIAERGETCGTVVASLMVIGLIFGGDQKGDRKAYEDTLIPANRFYDQFKLEIGNTTCGGILKEEFNRDFNLRNSEDLDAYRRSDGPGFCTTVVQNSVRMAAALIYNKIIQQ